MGAEARARLQAQGVDYHMYAVAGKAGAGVEKGETGRRSHCLHTGCEHQADQIQYEWEVPSHDRACDHLGHPGILHGSTAGTGNHVAVERMQARMIAEEAGPNNRILEAAEVVDNPGRHSHSAGKEQKEQHLDDAVLEHYLANSCSAAEGQCTTS